MLSSSDSRVYAPTAKPTALHHRVRRAGDKSSPAQLDLWKQGCLLYHSFEWHAAGNVFIALANHMRADVKGERFDHRRENKEGKALCLINVALIQARLGDSVGALDTLNDARSCDSTLPLLSYLTALIIYDSGYLRAAERELSLCLEAVRHGGALNPDDNDVSNIGDKYNLPVFSVDEGLVGNNLKTVQAARRMGCTKSSLVQLTAPPFDWIIEAPTAPGPPLETLEHQCSEMVNFGPKTPNSFTVHVALPTRPSPSLATAPGSKHREKIREIVNIFDRIGGTMANEARSRWSTISAKSTRRSSPTHLITPDQMPLIASTARYKPRSTFEPRAATGKSESVQDLVRFLSPYIPSSTASANNRPSVEQLSPGTRLCTQLHSYMSSPRHRPIRSSLLHRSVLSAGDGIDSQASALNYSSEGTEMSDSAAGPGGMNEMLSSGQFLLPTVYIPHSLTADSGPTRK